MNKFQEKVRVKREGTQHRKEELRGKGAEERNGKGEPLVLFRFLVPLIKKNER